MPLDLRPRWFLRIVLVAAAAGALSSTVSADQAPAAGGPHRSPVALAVSKDGSRLLTANQTAGTVSLIDTKSGTVLDEVATGDRPAGVAITADGRRGLVAHWFGYDVAVLEINGDRLKVSGRVEVGPEPRGVAIAPDGMTGFVAVGVANAVARVDLDSLKVTGQLTVGREPRGLVLTPDGKSLAVGNARSQNVSVIDTESWQVKHTITVEGDNLRQLAVSPDGRTGYVANMYNRGFATTRSNIDLGWVLGQRLTRFALDGTGKYATLSLDPRGKAAADAHGVAVSPDGKVLAVACGGTHEIMFFRTDLASLPWRTGGSRDVMAAELLKNDGRFRRVEIGGRPTEIAFTNDGAALYVANYLEDAVQVVDVPSGKVSRTIALGHPMELSLERQGEILFHAAERSFNQWYSCNTCHSDGHTSGLDFDTMNDGWHDYSSLHQRSRKKVPTLRRVALTGPWTWHGWQKRLEDAMVESFTKSMQGPRPQPDEVKALVAYLATLEYPRNPYREADGSLSPAARRGEEVYRSAKAGCRTCHAGGELTDGRIHNAGLEESEDVYHGYNPPSLRGTYDKDPYLHDGRAKTLRETLTGPHSPDTVNGGSALSEAEVDDLVAYLKSL